MVSIVSKWSACSKPHTCSVLRVYTALPFSFPGVFYCVPLCSNPHSCPAPGVFVFSSVPQNVTVMFPSGAGVEVRARGGAMATTVLLPQEFHSLTRGLLGLMNDDPDDDLVSSGGAVLPLNQTGAEALLQFGAGCECWRVGGGAPEISERPAGQEE